MGDVRETKICTCQSFVFMLQLQRHHLALSRIVFAELQDALDKIPESDILVVLGDFNARVGVLDQDSDLWRGILGRHGMIERKLAGHELLEFCAINNLSIMNTWFQKKEIHQGTWTHPATKRCHTIDFVLMRAGQRVQCKDVRAMRGGELLDRSRASKSKA